MMTEQTNNAFSVEDLCELAKLEGELLVVAAFERLDIGTQPDEDNFTDNQWTIASLARTFARGALAICRVMRTLHARLFSMRLWSLPEQCARELGITFSRQDWMNR